MIPPLRIRPLLAVLGLVCLAAIAYSAFPTRGAKTTRTSAAEMAMGPPPGCVLFVAVASAPDHYAKREAIRSTWMADVLAGRLPGVCGAFFIGYTDNLEHRTQTWKEGQQYRDIVFLEHLDTIRTLTVKTLGMIRAAFGRERRARYLLKCDDDNFIRMQEIIKVVKGRPLHGPDPLYWGYIHKGAGTQRQPEIGSYLTLDQWPEEHCPPFAQGSGYIVGEALGTFVLNNLGNLTIARPEDVTMGIWARAAGLQGMRVDFVHTDGVSPAKECTHLTQIMHHITPVLQRCMWQRLQAGYSNLCCFKES
jgi:hydroxyproline O-galactosyltransferase 2/3/4/5/6